MITKKRVCKKQHEDTKFNNRVLELTETIRKRNIPESSVAVEFNVQTHKEKGGQGEDGLPQSESETSAGAKSP